MTILAGTSLNARELFQGNVPNQRGSSFDLTVGKIYDHNGVEVDGLFKLQPGHLVQVVSNETFSLPDDVTGFVTYKTSLTKNGIWALTVGLVDPGWKGPLTTTLLNFSKIDHVIFPGSVFLRAIFFRHESVITDGKSLSPSIDSYQKEAQQKAITHFPETFLDQDKMVRQASSGVLKRLRLEGLAWVGLVLSIFTVASFGMSLFDQAKSRPEPIETRQLEARIARLETAVQNLKMPTRP